MEAGTGWEGLDLLLHRDDPLRHPGRGIGGVTQQAGAGREKTQNVPASAAWAVGEQLGCGWEP